MIIVSKIIKIWKRGCHARIFSAFLTFWKIFFKICRKLSKLLGNYGRNSRKYPTGPQICRVFDCGHITFRNIGPKSHYTYWIRGPPNFRGPLGKVEKQGGTPPRRRVIFWTENSVTGCAKRDVLTFNAFNDNFVNIDWCYINTCKNR